MSKVGMDPFAEFTAAPRGRVPVENPQYSVPGQAPGPFGPMVFILFRVTVAEAVEETAEDAAFAGQGGAGWDATGC
jgi:hypothetical protein